MAYHAVADAAAGLSAHAAGACIAAGCAIGHAATPLVLLIHAVL
jgi:hypothetical protein